MRLGADVEQLHRVADRMAASSGSLRGSLADLGAMVAATEWRGPDADRFRQQFAGVDRSVLGAALTRIEELADQLRRQAQAQADASADLAGVVSADRSAGFGPAATSPTRVRLLEVDVAGGNGVIVGGALTFRVEDIGAARVSVTEILSASAGGAVGAGGAAAVQWGDRSYGSEGAVQAQLSGLISGSQQWTLAESDLDLFVATRGDELLAGGLGRDALGLARSAASAATAALDSVFGIAGVTAPLPAGASAAARWLGELSEYEPPSPEVVGLAVGASTVAVAAAQLPAQSGRIGAALAADDRIEVRVDTTTGAIVAGLGSSGGAAFEARVRELGIETPSGGTDRSAGERAVERTAQIDSTAEVAFDASGTPQQFRQTAVIATDDSTMTRTTAVIDLTSPELRSAARDLGAALLGRGDLDAAVEQLVGQSWNHSQVTMDRYEVEDSGTYGINLGVAQLSVATTDLRLVR